MNAAPVDVTSHQLQDVLTIKGRTALVTAGASGMGRAAARLFAAHGAHVIVVDIDAARTEETVAELVGAGGSGEAHVVDLSDRPAVEAFLDSVIAQHDVLDVLFHHVGVTGPRALDFDTADWDTCMTLNVWVPTVMTQRLLPLLRRSRSASVVFTASTAGLVGVPDLPVYSATRGAVIQFMKSVALLLAPEGIRANAICPGGTDTAGMRAAFQEGAIDASLNAIAATVPLGRVGVPDDVARMALFLASDAASYLTGTVIPVDGGVTATART
ncbi:SDR family NAD(P)-dependent oxidoreductase [Streptomyces sp. NPDC091215]|uniref:SDR family NAD(P)-dependent oxidoreductase n=1 Tax=Streptomyces sp. NPDC091215 TaxID=3155192 RepID=UPI0034125B47